MNVNLITGLLLSPIAIILRGLTMMSLWSWFVVKQFHMSDLSFLTAIGICLLVSFLATDFTVERKDTNFVESMVISIVFSLLCWGTGYVYHLFL